MELEMFFSAPKWDILAEISKSPKSPIELATIFNTSVANISQQLRLMEAMGVVGKARISNSEKGKPRMKYYIKEEIIYLVRLGKSFASKQLVKAEPFTEYMFNVFSAINKKDQYFFLKFFWDNADMLLTSSIGLFKNTDKSLEFFIITEDVEKARKKISNIEILSPNGNSKRVICWSHNNSEIENGIKNNDPHFINLTKESETLLDEKGWLEKHKVMVKK